jgi:signal-transduction protein with cAMP-binding, CBS, and nucleotidyltransferase domain
MDIPIKRPEEILAYRSLRRILASKPRALWAVSPADSVLTALQVMAEKDIGLLVVMEQDKLVGVLSERDCARRVLLAKKSAESTPVADVMVRNVVTIDAEFTFADCLRLMHVNFEGHVVRSHQDIERIRRIVESMLSSARRKVHVIVNYDNFSIYPDILDKYSAMVRDLADRFYSGATRYSTNGFLRSRLGDALGRRALAPHIYESADEASAHLHELESKVAS